MRKSLTVLALSAAVMLSTIQVSLARSWPPEEAAVVAALEDAGFVASRIQSISINADRNGGEAGSGRGYDAWVALSGCDRSLIVRFNRVGAILEVYVPSACRS